MNDPAYYFQAHMDDPRVQEYVRKTDLIHKLGRMLHARHTPRLRQIADEIEPQLAYIVGTYWDEFEGEAK